MHKIIKSMKHILRKEKYENVTVEPELLILVRIALSVDLFAIFGGEDINYTETGYDNFVEMAFIPV